MENKPASLILQNVSYSFKNAFCVKDFSLEVKSGSFTTLLGPSGCGKTTILRLISGFLTPDSGAVLIDGIDQKGISPEKRKTGMVFQDYALFPHMSVEQNLLYGLNIKNKKAGQENHEKILKAARSLDILPLLKRYPHELSGGQQQRVALGRVLVTEPKIILMDEPLSALDSKLRESVREELKEIQNTLGITTVYVTHDQEEALSLSDNIAVIKDGALVQKGKPEDIYFNPVSRYVAEAAGRVNAFNLGGKEILVRPEWFKVIEDGEKKAADEKVISGTVLSSSFLGDRIRWRLRSDDNEKTVFSADFSVGEVSFRPGQKVNLLIVKSIQSIKAF